MRPLGKFAYIVLGYSRDVSTTSVLCGAKGRVVHAGGHDVLDV